MPVKLVVGAVIIAFVALELSPTFAALSFDRRFLPFGGCISGFFGGLSGHQGAFRSMFLIKAGIGKEQFIAAGGEDLVLVPCLNTHESWVRALAAICQRAPQPA